MAGQRKKRPFEDDRPSLEPQDEPRVKRTKTGHQQQGVHPTLSPQCPSQDIDTQKTVAPTLPNSIIPLTQEALERLDNMSSRRSKRSSVPSSLTSRRTAATTISLESGNSTKSDKITPYSNSFQQILADERIYMDDSRSRLANLDELQQHIDTRASLAPSQYSDGEIEDVIKANNKAATELDVERDVVPAIVGRRYRLPHSGNVSWTAMSTMTKGQTVAPQPDLYYGTELDDIDRSLRDRIGHLIVPSTVPNAPGLPHFILENKGPSGSQAVLKRQIAHSAAAAARSQFSAENFGKPEPEYNNEALVHAWGYSASTGDLSHHAMHVSRPEPGSSEPGYHLTAIKKYPITEGGDKFRKGVSAYRHWLAESDAKSKERLAKAHAHVRRHSNPLPPLPVSDEAGEPSHGYHHDWLEQQLQADCEASFSHETSLF